MNAVLVVSVLFNVVLLYVLLIVRVGRQCVAGVADGDVPPEVPRPEFRRFVGRRTVDVTGISGTGVPVEGVVFSDGYGVTHWLDRAPMNEPKTEVWHLPWWRRRGPDPFTKISGHNGATTVVWLDRVVTSTRQTRKVTDSGKES